jgi:hydroxymethylglutaryl-CoA synthase
VSTIEPVRGILTAAAYVPYRRLDRREISAFLGGAGGRGTRAVAAHDEDTTTMGVEAARAALKSGPQAFGTPDPDALWFSTATPAYLDKTNATTIHAALRLAGSVPAFDFGGALRSGTGALLTALGSAGNVLVVTADQRDGLPTSSDESLGGDAAAALLVGDDSDEQPVVATQVASASATDEIVDRWRAPGDQRSKVWEERFGETRYLAMGPRAWQDALARAGVQAGDVARVAVAGMHPRAVRAVAGRLGTTEGAVADDLTSQVGEAGSAHATVLLAHLLEEEAASLAAGDSAPGRLLGVLQLADGADVLLVRTTPALAELHPVRPVAQQVAHGAGVPYGKFLSWRGMLTPEPPRRPEPQRVSSPAAWRSESWKFAFAGSKDRSTGAVHLPPARISMSGGALDEMDPVIMADAVGTIATFTVDRMAYSPSPPVVFAVVDFEGGGRFPVELTDVDPDTLAIGDRVEMTFRRLFTADGIHDYFWKGRPVREHRASSNGRAAGASSRGSRAEATPSGQSRPVAAHEGSA